MKAKYIKIRDKGIEDDRYELYLYREGPSYTFHSNKSMGVPVLYVHGNAGHYRQVRSIGSGSARIFSTVPLGPMIDDQLGPINYSIPKTWSNDIKKELNYFVLDLKEELTGISSLLLKKQSEYLIKCTKHILSMYSFIKDENLRPKRVLIVGHSMGGIVSRLARVESLESENDLIGPIITFSTPHLKPPFPLDYSIQKLYNELEDKERQLGEPNIISIVSGVRDELISPDLSYYYDTPSLNLTLIKSFFSAGVANSWTRPDHLTVTWCRQLLHQVNSVIYDSINPNTNQISENIEILNQVAFKHLSPKLLDRWDQTLFNENKNNNNKNDADHSGRGASGSGSAIASDNVNNNNHNYGNIQKEEQKRSIIERENGFVVKIPKKKDFYILSSNSTKINFRLCKTQKCSKGIDPFKDPQFLKYRKSIVVPSPNYKEKIINNKEYFLSQAKLSVFTNNLIILDQPIFQNYSYLLINIIETSQSIKANTRYIWDFIKLSKTALIHKDFDYQKSKANNLIDLKNKSFFKIQLNSLFSSNFAYKITIKDFDNQKKNKKYLPLIAFRSLNSNFQSYITIFENFESLKDYISYTANIIFPKWSKGPDYPELFIWKDRTQNLKMKIQIDWITTFGYFFGTSWTFIPIIYLLLVSISFLFLKSINHKQQLNKNCNASNNTNMDIAKGNKNRNKNRKSKKNSKKNKNKNNGINKNNNKKKKNNNNKNKNKNNNNNNKNNDKDNKNKNTNEDNKKKKNDGNKMIKKFSILDYITKIILADLIFFMISIPINLIYLNSSLYTPKNESTFIEIFQFFFISIISINIILALMILIKLLIFLFKFLISQKSKKIIQTFNIIFLILSILPIHYTILLILFVILHLFTIAYYFKYSKYDKNLKYSNNFILHQFNSLLTEKESEIEKKSTIPSQNTDAQHSCNEVLVSKNEGYYIYDSEVGMFPNSNNIISLWLDYSAENYEHFISGKIFDTEGETVVETFTVEDETEHTQHMPNLGVLNETHFVSVFTKEHYTTVYVEELYGQIMEMIEINGKMELDVVGNDFLISSGSTHNSDLCVLNETYFVSVWPSHVYTQDHGSVDWVYGQLIKINSSEDDYVIEKIGSEVQINDNETSHAISPKATKLSENGDRFVVVWVDYKINDHGNRIVGQIFETAATKNQGFQSYGEVFQVNDERSKNHYNLALSTLADFTYFVVVWDSYDYNVDDYITDIFGRVFDSANGQDTDKPQRLNPDSTNYDQLPDVAPLSENRFAVIWQSLNETESIHNIIGQIFTFDRDKSVVEKKDEQFIVNSFSENELLDARISKNHPYNDKSVITWISMYYPSDAGSDRNAGYSIHAKIYTGEPKNTIQINKKMNDISLNIQSKAEVQIDTDLFKDLSNSDLEYSAYVVDLKDGSIQKHEWFTYQKDNRKIIIDGQDLSYRKTKTKYNIKILASTKCYQKSLYIDLKFTMSNMPIIYSLIISLAFATMIIIITFFFLKRKLIKKFKNDLLQDDDEDIKENNGNFDFEDDKDNDDNITSSGSSSSSSSTSDDEGDGGGNEDGDEKKGIKLTEMNKKNKNKNNKDSKSKDQKNREEYMEIDGIEKMNLIETTKNSNTEILKAMPKRIITLFIILQLYGWVFNSIFYGLILRNNLNRSSLKYLILLLAILQILIFQIFCLKLILVQINKNTKFSIIKFSAILWLACLIIGYILLFTDIEYLALYYSVIIAELSTVFFYFFLYYTLNKSKFCNRLTITTKRRVISNVVLTVFVVATLIVTTIIVARSLIHTL
ncbi:negative regulator of vesicle formation-related [Anaeramoeba flamelloides]|uniref:GPI inositol-deacylase n=1 Tax=Anaeramoeba flamelloides TaxID=1746091 RepID=A0ABQ8X8Q9_9EUKA|nr:negative regulator of vesicle formation-related [Anaeramoeba flamelloides]